MATFYPRRGFYRFGGDLLSHVLGRSTIGAAALNGRVRDGIGCFARAVATKPAKPARPRRKGGARDTRRRLIRRTDEAAVFPDELFSGRMTSGSALSAASGTGTRLPLDRNQACRAISTGQLNASPRLHLRPIDVVVFHGPQGRPGFEGGFPLRCLQRLSCPFVATQHRRWHDDWSTSGTFTPVLSY